MGRGALGVPPTKCAMFFRGVRNPRTNAPRFYGVAQFDGGDLPGRGDALRLWA